jgi:hypothetical protein
VTGRQRRPRFELTFHPDIEHDLVALDPAVLDVVPPLLEDLAYGRITGKVLGDRRVSGDLSGLARVKFDAFGQRPEGFRLVYRQIGDDVRDVLAIGSRDQHAIYRAAARRLTRPSSHGEG